MDETTATAEAVIEAVEAVETDVTEETDAYEVMLLQGGVY
jgi:hypothetical protein